MKCKIQRGLSLESLLSSLPHKYQGVLPPSLPTGPFTLLLFRNGREDVVLGRTVGAALDRVNDSEQLVAVGGSFTEEAVVLLRLRQALILQLDSWVWTDARYTSLRANK